LQLCSDLGSGNSDFLNIICYRLPQERINAQPVTDKRPVWISLYLMELFQVKMNVSSVMVKTLSRRLTNKFDNVVDFNQFSKIFLVIKFL
jgi:hypothetical protein